MKAKRTHKVHHAIASAKLSLKKMVSDVKDPLAIVGGMIVGKIVGDLYDTAMAKTSTVAGLRGVTSITPFVKPVVLIGAGLAAKQLLKNPLLKNVGIGVAAYGGATALNNVVNIPQLAAFGKGTTTTTTPGTNGLGTMVRRVLPASSAVNTSGAPAIL